MSTEKPFYVYVHRYASGPKQGQVFYVGKGKGRRAFDDRRGYNPYWKNLAQKYGFTVQIIIRFSEEFCAFSFERALIKNYGRSSLCNLTDGGEGMSGYKHKQSSIEAIVFSNKTRLVSIETREKMSKKRKGMQKKQSEIDSIRSRMIGNTNTLGMKHKPETIELMKQSRSGMKHPNFDHTVRVFFHSSGETFIGTQYDFCIKAGLNRTAISAVVSGKRKTHKGWHLK